MASALHPLLIQRQRWLIRVPHRRWCKSTPGRADRSSQNRM